MQEQTLTRGRCQPGRVLCLGYGCLMEFCFCKIARPNILKVRMPKTHSRAIESIESCMQESWETQLEMKSVRVIGGLPEPTPTTPCLTETRELGDSPELGI